MAAAALASSSGVTVSRTTKGLFLMFTLLCLVCLSSALIDKDQLEQLRETYQKTRQQIEKLKAEHEEEVASTTELMNEYMSFMDPMIALMKKTMQASHDADFPPLDKFMENVKNYVKQTEAYINRKHEEIGEKIEESEKKLGKTKKLIEFLEEQEADL
ncbi:uncharacterized protein LOC143417110 [Maylandia zebra]|uniref:uncharacterized protein LOC143417110 n=1 Tax=Maylandia zebra TaxID=106582 RepID=UPI00403D5412